MCPFRLPVTAFSALGMTVKRETRESKGESERETGSESEKGSVIETKKQR